MTNPLLSDQKMTTASGVQFDANIGCKASNTFLEILAVPTRTGDISLTISVDKNMDNILDSVYSQPIVSGICANGFIKCDAGTWNNCKDYEWRVNGNINLRPTLTPKLITSALQGDLLKSCYCVNNSCGSGLLINNFKTIIKDLGSGIANAFQKVNPYYTISGVEGSGPLIRFFGQEPASCHESFDGTLTAYKNNSEGLSTAAFSESSTNSLFETLTNSTAANHQSTSIQNCAINREIDLTKASVNNNNNKNNNKTFSIKIGAPGDKYIGYTFNLLNNTSNIDVRDSAKGSIIQLPTNLNFADLCNNGYEIEFLGTTDWFPPKPYDSPKYDTSVQRTVIMSPSCSNGMLGNLRLTDNSDGNGLDYKYALGAEFKFVAKKVSCDINSENIINACLPFETNADCRLKDENIDGVNTWVNFTSTGLLPIEQTRRYNDGVCNEVITKNWFQKSRKYSCTSGVTTWNFDDALQRQHIISSSATTSGYTDQQFDPVTGTSTTSTHSINIPDIPAPPACIKACKTRKLVNDTAVNEFGVSANNRADSTKYEYFFHECNQEACPAGTGETILKACACLNEFAEAASMMQILRLSGKDMVCTSGTKTPIE